MVWPRHGCTIQMCNVAVNFSAGLYGFAKVRSSQCPGHHKPCMMASKKYLIRKVIRYLHAYIIYEAFDVKTKKPHTHTHTHLSFGWQFPIEMSAIWFLICQPINFIARQFQLCPPHFTPRVNYGHILYKLEVNISMFKVGF